MSRDTIHEKNPFLTRFSKTATAAAILILLVQPAHAQNHFARFQTYVGTIDIASKGQGLLRAPVDPATGLLTVELNLDDQVPDDADIVAAFGYYVALEKTGAASEVKVLLQDPSSSLYLPPNPNPNDPAANTNHCRPTANPPITDGCLQFPVQALAKPLGNQTAPPCWAGGGSTGASQGKTTQRSYRLDLTRYFKLRPDPNNPNILRRVPWIKAQIKSSGSTGFQTPLIEGFSVVVVFRKASLNFKTVSLYDGSSTINNATDTFDLTMKFYQASTTPNARIGFGIADGQAQFPELLYVNGTSQNYLLANSPFYGQQGERWDNQEFNLGTLFSASDPRNVAPNATSLTTRISHGSGSFDCLSVVFTYAVVDGQDTDGDGLFDDWEKPVTGQTGGLRDIDTNELRLDLYSLGARYDHKDLFLEVDKMQEFANDQWGKPHVHDLKDQAIRLVGDALKNAIEIENPGFVPPPPNCGVNNAVCGIKLHVDAGSFTCPGSQYCGDPYVMTQSQFTVGGPEGGDVIDERKPAFFCDPDTGFTKCLFAKQPGVMVWKRSMEVIKNSHVENNPPGCVIPLIDPNSSNCKRYLSPWRYLVFHYLVMAHAMGVPAKDPQGNLLKDPTYGKLIVSTVSGRGELRASDVATALGKWTFSNPGDRFVGDAITQAGIVLHEEAHNLGGYHGGTPQQFDFTTNPPTPKKGQVCNPGDHSVLNYLYQRGLVREDGSITVDLSHGPPVSTLINATPPYEDEIRLSESAGLGSGTMPYRLRWYAPKANVEKLLGIPAGSLTSAKQYCDGSGLFDGTGGVVPPPADGTSGLVRIDSFGVARSPIDWNYNGTTDNSVYLNMNFDKFYESTEDFQFPTDFKGDWDFMINTSKGLQQIGMRRGLFGLSLGVGADDLLRAGEAEDAGLQDLSAVDLGEPEGGEPEGGEPEGGEPEGGTPALGEPEGGEPEGGELIDQPFQELGPDGLTGTNTRRTVELSWQAPLPPKSTDGTDGTIMKYTIYRATNSDPFVFLADVTQPPPNSPPGTPPATSYSDGTVQNNKTYSYYVTATVVFTSPPNTPPAVLGPSNTVMVLR